MDWIDLALLSTYGAASFGLFLYGMNCYVMLYCYYRNRDPERLRNERFRADFWRDRARESLPRVTTQLPVYNELFVIERLIDSVARLDYPRDRHQIQVLDDSTDETTSRIAEIVARYRAQGVDIVHRHRACRTGYKAGALAEGTGEASGELLAVFDADFLPTRDFLLETVPFLAADPRLAMVQTRWGHVNRDYSLLTQAQSIGIDGHFVVEQGARCWQGLFMNFNGTAGVWRKSAIEDAGGWQSDTLTEDLDLSYRVQLRGWRMKYLRDVVTPSEVPVDMNGLKSQQYRWAKGSIQCARKLLPLVFRAPVSHFVKIQAAFHLTHYLIHPLMMLVALLSLPALPLAGRSISRDLFLVTALFLVLSTLSPSILYMCSQREVEPDWKRRTLLLPALITLGIGIALNNTRAVLDGIFGRTGAFERTPKYGVIRAGDHGLARRRGLYRSTRSAAWLAELALGAYGFYTLWVYGLAGKWAVAPFLLMNAVGFSIVGLLSVWQGRSMRSAVASAG